MITIYDRATMARVAELGLDPRLVALLQSRGAALGELIDWTEFLVVQAGDTEADIVREVGFSPLVEPIDAARFGTKAFQPFWDHLAAHDGWFEMAVSFGSAFAYILLIEDADGTPPLLRCLCHRYAA